MSDNQKIIMSICIIVILLTLRIKINDNSLTIQFGLWQLIKDWINNKQ